MANANKTFLSEAERSVLTPRSALWPRDARERFFEAGGNFEGSYRSPVRAKKKK